MKRWIELSQGFSRWIDLVADFVAAQVGRFASPRTLKLVELRNGEFEFHGLEKPDSSSDMKAIRIVDGQIAGDVPKPLAATLRGSRIELTLTSDRFLFRPLELPGRAAEFLDGIVQAQIDRLTPWTPAEAAFGWSKPHQADPDRIVITVAATARALVAPYVQAIAKLGAQSIAVFTTSIGDPNAVDSIKVMEEKPVGFSDVGRIRHALIIILVTACATAAAALGGSAVARMNLDAQKNELEMRIAKFRAAAVASRKNAAGTFGAAQQTLESRKQSATPNVIILETLSQILPDSTYVTELRIENNKIQLVGVTHDAPSLISLMEQSGSFTDATFFAPTTHSPSDPGQRFHIEAHIQPTVAAPS